MDVRSRKTKEQICEHFLAMLNQTHISQITITELCSKVGINRATFYKHYLDIYHLQAALEKEALAELESYARECIFSGKDVYQTALTDFLTYMKQRRDLFCVLCSPNAGTDLPVRIFQLFHALSFPVLIEKLQVENIQEAKLLYQYVSHGCGSILRSWFQGELEMTASEIVAFMIRASSAAVADLARGDDNNA